MSTFKIGDQVKYEIWDGEEGRGYGWFINRKTAKIISIVYVMDNGDKIAAEKLVLVEAKQPTQTQTSSDRPPATTG